MLKYDRHDTEATRQAKSLLEQLKPEAIRLAAEDSQIQMTKTSGLGANMSRHWHIDLVSGVHVYQGELGGWFADVAFDGLPAGIPNVIGTASSRPLESREQAIGGAITLLALIILNRRDAPATDEMPVAVFPFDGVEIQIESSLIAGLKAAPDKPDRQFGLDQLQAVRERFASGQPMTVEVMESLSIDDRVKVFTAAAMAMALGILRFPENEGEVPPKSKRH